MQIEWTHILTEGAVYLAPTLGLGYLGYRKLIWMLGEYRPHNHTEREKHEVLTVSGIQYPRQFNGKP